MKKSRVLWGLWLLMSVIFCMATDSMAGYLLVLLSVIVPLLAALPVRRAAKRLETELTISAYGEKGTAFAGKILLTNKSLFPTDRILCRVSCENLLTGEKEVISHSYGSTVQKQYRYRVSAKEPTRGQGTPFPSKNDLL